MASLEISDVDITSGHPVLGGGGRPVKDAVCHRDMLGWEGFMVTVRVT